MEWLALLLSVLILALGILLVSAIPLVSRRQPQQNPGDPDCAIYHENVNFTTSDGINLSGWWFPYKSPDRTIIMLHGYAGSMDPDLKYVTELHAAGYNVLMFDFRAHGRSSGRISTLGALERKDVQSAVSYALSQGSSHIGLLGFSMGGRAAILSAPLIPQVRAIVCDSAPARLSTAISQKLISQKNPAWLSHSAAFLSIAGASLLSGINLFRVEPLHQASRLAGTPVLFIYGGKDPFVTSSEIETMVNAAGEQAESWIVPEAGHRDVEKYHQEEYMQVIKDFFHKNLQLPPEES